ncbi:MAG: CcmD family protein [Verrucomicrobiota bacterium]
MRRRAGTVMRLMTMVAVNVTAAVALAVPAGAQEFVKVDDGVRDQLPATPFLGAAYGFIWVAMLAYVLMMARRMGRVQNQLQELRSQLERAGGSATARRST